MNNHDIPVIILNRDRLTPLKQLVDIMRKKNYNNITIIDNQSTYDPLLEWYKSCGAKVWINTTLPNDINTLYYLLRKNNPEWLRLTEKHFVFTDSDTVPIDSIPDNFIDDMIYYCDKYKKDKIGLGCKLDDMDLSIPMAKYAYGYEITYWTNGIQEEKATLYPHPIDSTFALYRPGYSSGWSANTFRMGYPYMMRHMPFYYFGDNMPDDEKYYLQHMNVQSGACFSKRVKAEYNL